MGRASTASYVLTCELLSNAHERKILDKKLNIGRQIYNSCLGEALKRLRKVQADKEYREVLGALMEFKNAKSKEDKAEKKRLSIRLSDIERSYGYSEYALHNFVKEGQKHFLDTKTVTKAGKPKQGLHIGSLEAQVLATRAFRAVKKLHYHEAEKVYFKRYGESISIENKNNVTGLRYVDGHVLWGELKLSLKVKRNDLYMQYALMDKTKYIRILKREIRGKERFFVQLIQEGIPPVKERKKGTGGVGLDIGPSTIAMVSDEAVELRELAPGIVADSKKLRRAERAMDRSKRATNPDNFDQNGVVKKGSRNWIYSNRYQKLRARRKELHRKIAAGRKQSHEILANEILAQGDDIRVETMRFQGLQKRAKETTRNQKNGKINKKKRFGKSIGNHAPAMFLSILERKLAYEGLELKKVDTFELKASQFNHVTGEYQKKLLSERWNDIGGRKIQRDLYSAFLIGNTNKDLCSVNVEECNRRWEVFVRLHDREVERVRKSGSKALGWYVA